MTRLQDVQNLRDSLHAVAEVIVTDGELLGAALAAELMHRLQVVAEHVQAMHMEAGEAAYRASVERSDVGAPALDETLDETLARAEDDGRTPGAVDPFDTSHDDEDAPALDGDALDKDATPLDREMRAQRVRLLLTR